MTISQNVTEQSGFPSSGSDNITLYEYFCAGGASACSGGGASTGGINLSAATAGFMVYTLNGNGASSTATTSSCFNNGSTNSSTDCAQLSSSSLLVANSSLINFLASNYALGFSQIYTYSTLSVVTGTNTTTALNFFTEGYYQELNLPEPGTFSTLGAALAALCALALRKRG
jgi:hypothetical protein